MFKSFVIYSIYLCLQLHDSQFICLQSVCRIYCICLTTWFTVYIVGFLIFTYIFYYNLFVCFFLFL